MDDLTLAGPRAARHKLCPLVNVEPPEPIYGILGQNHVYVEHSLPEETKVQALAFDMCDYAQQTVDLYRSITKVDKIKHTSTPFLPDGSILPQDEEVSLLDVPQRYRLHLYGLQGCRAPTSYVP